MDSIPIGVLFAAVVIIIYVFIELGFKAGNTHSENSKKAKEKITSHNSAAILGMLGFILVFTFGIVYNRYDSKKDLVREEANVIRTTWLRSDFLEEKDQRETVMLLKKYVDLRLDIVRLSDTKNVDTLLKESRMIQSRVWELAVINARKDMNSDIGAMYIESLNEMFNIQALRIAVGMQARIPTVILVLLFTLIILGMFSVGYMVSVSESSRKSWLTPVMVLTFSLLISMIVALDRPNSIILPVPQQPLIDVRAFMEESAKVPLLP